MADADFEYWRVQLTNALPRDMPSQLREKLETIYTYANERSLRTRLNALLSETLNVSRLENCQRDRKSFVSFVVGIRNRLTHGIVSANADADLVPASIDLAIVFLRLLLARLGCSENLTASAARRFPWSVLARSGAE